jgi:hypothetical protein
MDTKIQGENKETAVVTPCLRAPKPLATQSFFGADDLDIGPATNGTMTLGRVWIDEHSPIESELTVDTSGWTPGTSSVTFQVHDPQGNAHGGGTVTLADAKAHASSRAAARGWHAIVLTSSGLPPKGAQFTFKIEYTAPQTITPEQF